MKYPVSDKKSAELGLVCKCFAYSVRCGHIQNSWLMKSNANLGNARKVCIESQV